MGEPKHMRSVPKVFVQTVVASNHIIMVSECVNGHLILYGRCIPILYSLCILNCGLMVAIVLASTRSLLRLTLHPVAKDWASVITQIPTQKDLSKPMQSPHDMLRAISLVHILTLVMAQELHRLILYLPLFKMFPISSWVF